MFSVLRVAARWFHLSRWENYCLLAIASLAFLGVVVLKTDARADERPAASRGEATRLRLGESGQIISPSPRSREAAWKRRHALIKARTGTQADVLLLGDSITQGWEYKYRWHQRFPAIRAINAGIVSDGAQHILWRTRDGLFDKARPKVVILMAGTNNLALHDEARIAATQASTIRWIRSRSPETKILLMGVLPMGREGGSPRRAKIARLNERLARLADGDHVHFLDFGSRLLERDGSLTKATSFDGTHLTAKGYEIWARAMGPKLAELLQAAST